jgi:tRNA(adenine34) deaminase
VTDEDTAFVRRTIEMACEAVEEGNRPYAAILIAADGKVLAECVNLSVQSGDPFSHAEIVLLRMAHLRYGMDRIRGATMYANCEPCTMCAGALIRYSIARVVFGLRFSQMPASSRTAPGGYSSEPVFAIAKPPIDFVGGVLEEESRRPFDLHTAKAT